MKILFVTDLYPISEKEKHTPKTLFDFVNEWQNQNHQVEVLKPNFLLNTILRKKTFYKTGQYGNVYNVNYFTPFLFDVKNKIPKYNYDVIIAHMPSGIIFSNKLEGKLICAVHTSDIEVLTNPLYKFYFKAEMEKAYNRSIGIACRSEALKIKFLNLYPQYKNKTFVAESGINSEIIFERKIKEKSENVKILTCAQLIKRKNIDKVILAVKELKNCELTVIGSGEELSKLKKLNKNVKFTGQLPHSQVLEYMRSSDIFILPSEKETFGMVYLEAMASGCITVGTVNDGIAGIIKDDNNGFLVEPKTEKIKEKIENILSMNVTEINFLLHNCYNTVKDYELRVCADRYIKNILKII